MSVVPLRPGPVSTTFRSFALEGTFVPKRDVSLFDMPRMVAQSESVSSGGAHLEGAVDNPLRVLIG